MVRQRSIELETGGDWKRGVEGLEKNPNLELILGLGVGFVLSCFSLVSRSLGIDVQKALRHPKTIVSALILFSAFCCFSCLLVMMIIMERRKKKGWGL